jgi:O-antigen/teichoic acid export membrane protein
MTTVTPRGAEAPARRARGVSIPEACDPRATPRRNHTRITSVPPQPFHSRLLAVSAGELLNKVAVAAAFVWLARTIDPSVYGQIEWALSVTMTFLLVADAGLSTSATAEVASRPDQAAVVVARVGWLRLGLAVPAYLLLLLTAWAKGGAAGSALAIYGLVLFLQPLYLQYLFDGLLQTRWTALGNALRGATFLVSVLLLVGARSQASAVAIAEVLGASTLAACNLVVVRRIFKLPIRFEEGRHGLSALLARTWRVGASDVTWGVQTYAGLIYLGYMASPQDTAWHSSSLRLLLTIHTGVWLYLTTLLPNLARLAHDPAGWKRVVEQSLRLTGWVGLSIALVGVLAAPTILTTVFGPPFVAATVPFRVLIWVVPVSWMSGHIRYSLIAARHPEYEYRARLVGAGTTIVLTLILAPSLKSSGTALALLCGIIANAVAAWALMRRVMADYEYAKSMATSSVSCLGCLLFGFLAIPVVGEVRATLAASALMVVTAVFVERHRVRDLAYAVLGGRADRQEGTVSSKTGTGP